MTGPAAWDALRERLATAAGAITDAKQDLEAARASLTLASEALAALHVDEEELDARRARDAVDVPIALELYRHSDRVVGLDRLRQDAAEGLSRLELELVSIETISAFTLARAFVDTLAADLADLVASYETVDDG